ncbi:MAG: DMT family transporter [Proteobacteria bacterium]|nr:DMT family transporter [Pseudomonadota bacterium]
MAAAHETRDWIRLGALVLMWGTAFVFIRLAVETVSPSSVAAGRIAAAALILCVAVPLSGLHFPAPGRIWLYFLVLGIVGNALPFFLISWGQQRIPSGLAAILMAVNPLITLMLAHRFVPGERATTGRTAGFVLGFLGMLVLVGPDAIGELAETRSAALRRGAVLAGALCYAMNSILVRRMPETNALVASASVLAMAALVMVPLALVLAPPTSFAASLPSLAAVAWLGVVPTALATIVYFRVIASAGPTFFSLVNYLVPLVALGAGFVAYDERPTWRAFAALALVLSGIALTRLRRRAV